MEMENFIISTQENEPLLLRVDCNYKTFKKVNNYKILSSDDNCLFKTRNEILIRIFYRFRLLP